MRNRFIKAAAKQIDLWMTRECAGVDVRLSFHRRSDRNVVAGSFSSTALFSVARLALAARISAARAAGAGFT